MSDKSLLCEMQQVQLAIELVELGARIQVLESETELSRARLLKLYKEVRGNSPPRGMLPFSTDWFVTWLPNIHSSLFYNFYLQLTSVHGCQRMDGFVKAYRMYLEQMQLDGAEPVLGLTRAWTLLRFFESELLELMPCQSCGGRFVVHAHTPGQDFVCGICAPPSRAGTARRAFEGHHGERILPAAGLKVSGPAVGRPADVSGHIRGLSASRP